MKIAGDDLVMSWEIAAVNRDVAFASNALGCAPLRPHIFVDLVRPWNEPSSWLKRTAARAAAVRRPFLHAACFSPIPTA